MLLAKVVWPTQDKRPSLCLQGHEERAGSFWPGLLRVTGKRPAFELGGGEGLTL